MKFGNPVRRYSLEDKHEVILRTPRWEDLDDFLDLANPLVEERAEISRAELE